MVSDAISPYLAVHATIRVAWPNNVSIVCAIECASGRVPTVLSQLPSAALPTSSVCNTAMTDNCPRAKNGPPDACLKKKFVQLWARRTSTSQTAETSSVDERPGG